jgi:mono/diheme cytochrome c family protein
MIRTEPSGPLTRRAFLAAGALTVSFKLINLPGQAIFSRSCAGCHESNGVSQLTPLATLTGSRAVNDPSGANALQAIFYGERDYKNMMPAFGAVLSDDDIANVVNYITSRFGTKPSTLTPVPEAIPASGAPSGNGTADSFQPSGSCCTRSPVSIRRSVCNVPRTRLGSNDAV